MSIIKSLKEDGLFNVEQKFIYDTELEVMMGSVAYGAATGPSSDIDVHAICIPDIEIVFPHTITGGYVEGFTQRPTNFESSQQHHIKRGNDMYDVCVYSIVKAFSLAVDNNPNVLDILWTPDHCVLRKTEIGHHIRKNRQLFLSKVSYHRFRGYAYAQQKRMGVRKDNKSLNDLMEFESSNGISHITTLDDIVLELDRRGLS